MILFCGVVTIGWLCLLQETVTLEELIERERAKLGSNLTRVTFDTFMAWKAKKVCDNSHHITSYIGVPSTLLPPPSDVFPLLWLYSATLCLESGED